MSKPRISVLDPKFRYRNAASTDVSLTFRRARMQLRAAARQREAAAPKPAEVRPLKRVAR